MRKTERMGALIIEFCRGHGMLPDLKPKKTTAIIALRGTGAQKAKRQWFPRGAKAIHLKDVAADYVHLGGVIDPEVKLTQEVRRRLGQAKAAYDSGKKLIYSNATIPLPVRAALFRMSVSSTYYNLGLWVPTGPDGKRWKEASPGWCGTYTGHAFPRGMTSSRARRRPYTC